MRFVKYALTFLLVIFLGISSCFAQDYSDLREYEGIELSRGTFLPVIALQEISTLYCDLGSKVEFLSTTDLYLNEVNIIPKGSKYYGYVEDIKEPVVGTNASMIIKVVKLVLPDGFEMPMRAYINTAKGNVIGGEKTAPASYIEKRSRMQGLPSRVGYVPGPTLKRGEHVTIASGANLIIMLVAPLYITHTVTN